MINQDKMIIGVSACFAHPVRFDGQSKKSSEVSNVVKIIEQQGGKIEYICPEVLGGLPTPRDAAEIVGNNVITVNGEDVTENFKEGAEAALSIINKLGIKAVILKSKSPSCGVDGIYDGSFTGNLIEGKGFTAKLLYKQGIKVFSENNLDEFLEWFNKK